MTCIRLGTDSKLKGINDWTCKVTFAFLSHKSKKKNSQKKKKALRHNNNNIQAKGRRALR